MRLQLSSLLVLPILRALASQSEQVVMDHDSVYVPQQSQRPSLADLLTIQSSASIFYSYARELETSTVFSSLTHEPVTLLVPTNKAVMSLSRKPHQGPVPIQDGVILTEQEYDSRSKENVERWISAHIIPESPISFDGRTYPTMLDGRSVMFELAEGGEPNEWSRAVLDGHVHIISKHEASNGVLYFIDGTVSLD
ncbi:unnamed protein product [Mycena citricolor]|uniref:FAS1 domain-containing protein n=1 Tax=Mycena citricolor TaxID=2018698 RepID=A0AAD2Q5Y9_9AGAR|nr:unnamed protein product [Mycena citricolor]CAK5280945.1 unnamed protein product [Mycena citricolor]